MSCANILCLTRDKKQRFAPAFVIVCSFHFQRDCWKKQITR
ncbi:hypothetical protein KPK_2775 [Klebsiella variicola]|uniref:Uncharacterized protein n=1 Tax=Klebsiella variicola (strain 342) TaxID=507522 RepID=B5XQY1_KLEV3|nr:hypothetical protein KPK_2775 [Klebsiella variicola]